LAEGSQSLTEGSGGPVQEERGEEERGEGTDVYVYGWTNGQTKRSVFYRTSILWSVASKKPSFAVLITYLLYETLV